MKCPKCGCMDSVRCYRTSASEYSSTVSRHRRCMACGTKFETKEQQVTPATEPTITPKPEPKTTRKRKPKSQRPSLEQKIKQQVANLG